MRAKEAPPEQREVLVHKNKKTGMYTWYVSEARPLGDIQYRGINQWVTEDGRTFSNPYDGYEYLAKRATPPKLRRDRAALPPGKWNVRGYKGIRWVDPGRELVIDTADGPVTLSMVHEDL